MQANIPKPHSPFRMFLRKFMKQKLAVVAGCMVLLIILVGLFGRGLAPYDPAVPVDRQYAAKGIDMKSELQKKLDVTAIMADGAEVPVQQLPKPLKWSSEHAEVAKVSLTGSGVKIVAASKGQAAITLNYGDAASVLQVEVSTDSAPPVLSMLTAALASQAWQAGESRKLDLTGQLTDGEALTDTAAVKAYLQKLAPEQEEAPDNGFVTGGTTVAASGLTFQSLTPAVVSVSADGEVKALGEGVGMVKIQAGNVSSVAVIPVGNATTSQASSDTVVALRLASTQFELQDSYKHQHPSTRHWFGTDHANRDIFSRILAGTKQTLIIGFVSVFIGAFIGIVFGLLAGYYGRWIDTLISRGSDILLSFPGILLAIFVVAVAGPGMLNIILAVATFTVPIFIRIVRGSVLSLKEMTYVEAARSIGVRDSVIIIRHIFPGTISVVMIYLTMRIGSAILIGAGLSYLGLGGDVTAPEWGSMLSAAKNNSMTEFFPIFFPGVAIVITVLSFNLLGDGLRDALDPKLKE